MRSRRGVYSQSAQPMRDKATRELAGQARGKESSGVNVGNSNSDANNHTNPSASEPKKSASKLRRESRRKELFAHVRGCALESAPASVTATGETAAVGEFASEHPSSSSLRRLQLTGSDTSRSVSSSSLSLSGSESGTDSDCESQPPQPQSQPFGTSLYKEDVSDILSFGLALASLKSDDHHEDPTLLGSTTLKRNALLPLEPHTATTPATTSIPSLKQVAAASSPCFASPALPPITKPFAYASASASSTSSRTASNTPPASATMIASGKANSKTAAMEAHFFRALAESEIAIKTTLRRAADSLMSNDSGSSDSAGITPGFSFSSVPSVDLGESSAQTISSYSTTTPRPRFGNLTPTCHTTLLDRRNDALPFARFNNAEDEVLSSERLDQLLRNLERNALDGGDSTSLEIVEDDEEDDVDDEATEVESSIPWGAEGKKQVQPHLKPADVHAFRASTESLCSVDSFQTAYSATSVTLGPAARVMNHLSEPL
ncbi:hypothetical protein BC830DRAFT_344255 [Chytriomyces sp. MP71]|nr:hypothetical protein BC830DRAFT_344255 [Chytriomyces sp. MP71]